MQNFYKKVMTRAKKLAGSLMSVCHIFDAVDKDFMAMQMFQAIEEEFTATLLEQIQSALALQIDESPKTV